MSWSCNIDNGKQMVALGKALAHQIKAPQIIFLQGDLGAGKTTFVQGMMQGFGYTGLVKSPTYGIVEPYESLSPMIYHFDLYRLHDPEELELIGLDDYIHHDSVCIFEWPSRALAILPAPTINIVIQILEKGRHVTCTGLEYPKELN